jgi:predicted transcriptional regulator
MGGPGSGRWPRKLSVDACRVLEIGELCDGGRWASQPRGEIRWLTKGLPEVLASLSYAIAAEEWSGGPPEIIVTLRYRETLGGPERRQGVMLDLGAQRAVLALCPGCGRRVRKLYTRPGDVFFCCRSCQGLVYRRNAAAEARERLREYGRRDALLAADLRAELGPLREELDEPDTDAAARDTPAQRHHQLEALLGRLTNEPPLAPEERRIYCLRLARVGFSLRRIAALVGCSKSSVQRYLAAGPEGIDIEELGYERQERLRAPSPELTGSGSETPYELAVMTTSYLRRLGLDRQRASDLEQRVVIAAPVEQTTASNTQTIAPYTDTRLGHQQIAGQPAPELPGALWRRDLLEKLRVKEEPRKPAVWQKVVAAIEASLSAAQESGVIVAALGLDDQVYLLADHSGHYPADRWAALVVSLCESRKAACVATGDNDAGKLVKVWLGQLDPSVLVQLKHLTYDGELPAAPVSALYVQGRVHHIGVYPALENEMVSFTARRKHGPPSPPERVAALVWALTELVVGNQPPRARGVWLPPRR